VKVVTKQVSLLKVQTFFITEISKLTFLIRSGMLLQNLPTFLPYPNNQNEVYKWNAWL
jgi:hypothetical protein